MEISNNGRITKKERSERRELRHMQSTMENKSDKER